MAEPRTLNELFFQAMDRFAARPVVMRVKRDDRWTDLSYKEVLGQVREASLGLQELGVQRGDRVAILSENRPEWAAADYACLAAGCADVPIYPTLPANQAAYILRDSGAVAVCVSNAAQFEKIASVLPAMKKQALEMWEEGRRLTGHPGLPLEPTPNLGAAD